MFGTECVLSHEVSLARCATPEPMEFSLDKTNAPLQRSVATSTSLSVAASLDHGGQGLVSPAAAAKDWSSRLISPMGWKATSVMP